MMGDGAASGLGTDASRAAPMLPGKGEYGTLVLDGFGKIRSCGSAAARMLGCGLTDLTGKSVSEFIAGFARSESSLSFSTRYIAHLCTEGGWRRFTVVDYCGHAFEVELALSRVTAEGQDFFLLNLRRLEEQA